MLHYCENLLNFVKKIFIILHTMKKLFIDFLFETTNYVGLTFPFVAGAYKQLHNNDTPTDCNYIKTILNDIVENANKYYIVEECQGIDQLVIKQLDDDYGHKKSIRHYRISNTHGQPIIYFEEYFAELNCSIDHICKKIISKYPYDCFSKKQYSINGGAWGGYTDFEQESIDIAICLFNKQGH